jgi:hypothetical protein
VDLLPQQPHVLRPQRRRPPRRRHRRQALTVVASLHRSPPSASNPAGERVSSE